MYCGQCGKRVLETMLFCPFCGSPIVIPDQDEAEPIPAAPVEPEEQLEAVAPEPEPVFEVLHFDEEPEEQPEAGAPEPEPAFEPLRFDGEPEEQSTAEAAEPEPTFAPLRFDGEPEEPAAPADEPEEEPVRPASLFDGELAEEEEPFVPLKFDEGEIEEVAPVLLVEEVSEEVAPQVELQRPQSPARRKPEGSAPRRSNQTYIPVKNVDIEDMFMDSTPPEPEDEYDPYDDDGGDFEEEFRFEEPERGSFLQRHIRGVVGLILLGLLLIIFLIWSVMPKGQRMLASANLAWNAEVYNDLGYDSYKAGQFHQAATYFERALARDEKNYEYAHSAMVAYYEANEMDAALAMLKKCIEMNPDDSEPYHELLILYPNAADRPWEAQELLRLGYERTGDESLNASGE